MWYAPLVKSVKIQFTVARTILSISLFLLEKKILFKNSINEFSKWFCPTHF